MEKFFVSKEKSFIGSATEFRLSLEWAHSNQITTLNCKSLKIRQSLLVNNYDERFVRLLLTPINWHLLQFVEISNLNK